MVPERNLARALRELVFRLDFAISAPPIFLVHHFS